MHFFLFLTLSLMFFSYLLLLCDNRNFFAGMMFGVGSLLLLILLFFAALIKLSDWNDSGQLLSLLIFYGGIPLIIILIACYLAFNSRTMHHKEGRSVVAKLSVALGLNIVCIIPLTFYQLTMMHPWPTWVSILIMSFCLIDLTFLFGFAAYLFYSWFYQMMPLKHSVDYIIVLGAGIRSEEVTPLLKSRLDQGLNIFRQNPQAVFVVSGGQGPDEPVSEAFAMNKYLRSQGVPQDQILLEDQSTSTYENMHFSKKLLLEHDTVAMNKHIIFTTNNYHVLRAAGFARKVKLPAEGVGSPTALYYLPSALIREYIGLLVQYKYWTASICLAWVLLVTATYF